MPLSHFSMVSLVDLPAPKTKNGSFLSVAICAKITDVLDIASCHPIALPWETNDFFFEIKETNDFRSNYRKEFKAGKN